MGASVSHVNAIRILWGGGAMPDLEKRAAFFFQGLLYVQLHRGIGRFWRIADGLAG